jgi:hypothetical protein
MVVLYRVKEAAYPAMSSGCSPAQINKRMETRMSDPAHLRAKAQLCSAIADLMSDPADANTARQTAEQYASQAEKAERERADQQRLATRTRKASG